MKILILKPSSLGDVVQALPVLRLLKAHWPAAEVYWWIATGLKDLLQNDPDLSGLIPFDRRAWTIPWRWPRAFRSLTELRAHRFDLVIDLQGLFRSASVAWLARGSYTVGVDDPREGGRAFYDLAVPRPGAAAHAVDWYIEVLRALRVPVHDRFQWFPRELPAAGAIRAKWGIDGHRWIAVQPGARWETKRWPVERFASAIARLSGEFRDVRFAILGDSGDTPLAQEIARSLSDRCLDLTGQTSLPEMVAWIAACDLMLTNDTGPMHVAAALGRPVVAIFGPTDHRRTGPYGQLHNVVRVELPCTPCLRERCGQPVYIECLRSVTAEVVCEVAERLMNVPAAAAVSTASHSAGLPALATRLNS